MTATRPLTAHLLRVGQRPWLGEQARAFLKREPREGQGPQSFLSRRSSLARQRRGTSRGITPYSTRTVCAPHPFTRNRCAKHVTSGRSPAFVRRNELAVQTALWLPGWRQSEWRRSCHEG